MVGEREKWGKAMEDDISGESMVEERPHLCKRLTCKRGDDRGS